MLRLPSEGDGVLIFDDTGFAKQGHCSVGVARQYSGTWARPATVRSPSTVIMPNGPSPGRSPPGSARHWAQDTDRRKKAKVPEDLVLQTKPKITLELLVAEAKTWGVHGDA